MYTWSYCGDLLGFSELSKPHVSYISLVQFIKITGVRDLRKHNNSLEKLAFVVLYGEFKWKISIKLVNNSS